MECRSAIGKYDNEKFYNLYCSSQAYSLKNYQLYLILMKTKLMFLPDVGGGFGMKILIILNILHLLRPKLPIN